jgi:hypothetical protein
MRRGESGDYFPGRRRGGYESSDRQASDMVAPPTTLTDIVGAWSLRLEWSNNSNDEPAAIVFTGSDGTARRYVRDCRVRP